MEPHQKLMVDARREQKEVDRAITVMETQYLTARRAQDQIQKKVEKKLSGCAKCRKVMSQILGIADSLVALAKVGVAGADAALADPKLKVVQQVLDASQGVVGGLRAQLGEYREVSRAYDEVQSELRDFDKQPDEGRRRVSQKVNVKLERAQSVVPSSQVEMSRLDFQKQVLGAKTK